MKWFSYLIRENKSLLIGSILAAIIVLLVIGCSRTPALKTYTPLQAIANGDVVDVHGKVTNLEKLENFMSAVDHGKASSIKITSYTDEGDPIFQVLDYNDKTITMNTDNSQDKFAGPMKGCVTYNSFTKIIKDDTQSPPSYYLVDSTGNEQFLLTVTKILPPMPMDDIRPDEPGYTSKYPKLDISSDSVKINWVRSTANYTSKPDGQIGNSSFGVEIEDALALSADVVKPGARLDFKAADVPGLETPSYKVKLVGKNNELTDYPVDNNSIVTPYYAGEYIFNLEVKWGNENHQIFYWFKISSDEAIKQIGLKINNGLPTGWDIYLNGDKDGQILKNGKVVGQIEMTGYYGDNSSLPNHSSIAWMEDIVSGIGKAKMYILDRDTPAASPEQRTWTEIYVVAPIANSSLAFWITIETNDNALNSDIAAMKNIVKKLALK